MSFLLLPGYFVNVKIGVAQDKAAPEHIRRTTAQLVLNHFLSYTCLVVRADVCTFHLPLKLNILLLESTEVIVTSTRSMVLKAVLIRSHHQTSGRFN